MQGVHVFDPHAETVIILESFVEDDHVLRKIDGLLDMAFIRELTAVCYADGLGRPSIDPEVFFRMELVAYLYGVRSERLLCKEVRYNLAYRWFCRLSPHDDVPDHSSLSRIRDRYGEKIFENVFREIVALCRKKGLVHEQGKYLTPTPAIAGNQKRYVSSSVDCQDCPRRSTCPTEARKKLPCKRYVRRSLDQDLFEEVQAQIRDPTFRQTLSERMWKCEGLFAEAKQNHGLARARYRGRRKVQIQACLSAMVQNLKRLVFLFCYWLISWWSREHKNPTPSRAQPSQGQTFSTRPLL